MNDTMTRKIIAALAGILFLTLATPAFALLTPWGIDLQPAASPTAERMHEFHHMMLYIITGISLFVLALLVWVVIRYNKWTNKTPQQFSHNVAIEIIWTVVPIIILIIIAVPSMKLLYYVDRTKTPEMTLKVTGHQWYWSYEYPDHGGIAFDSYMIPDKDIDPSKGQVRLLSVDNPVILPIDTDIRIWVTAADVLHSWAMPTLGLKTDSIPGRLNETWVRITKPGVYYGQCSELCGKDHSYMPIEIRAVSKEEFAAWVVEKGGKMPEVKPAAAAIEAAPAEAAATPEAIPATDNKQPQTETTTQ